MTRDMGRDREDGRIPAAIAEQAVGWFVRRDAGTLPAADARAFEHWLASPIHAAAYRAVERDWAALNGFDAATRRDTAIRAFSGSPRRSRRHGLALVAASLLIVIGLWWTGFPGLLLADHRTALGERKTVALADGSRIELNTDTALDIAINADRRQIRLLRGEAIFHAAPDAARPFVVSVAQGTVTALGTVFVVRRTDADVQVAAIEHRIAVAASAQSQVLNPGEAVAYDAAGLGLLRRVDPELATSWRYGKLVFEQKPLGEVVAELARYRPGLLYLRGAGLADRAVSGVVDLGNIDIAVDHIARSLGLDVQRYAGLLTVIQP